MDFNRVTLIGNLARDPEEKVFESGRKLSVFSVATNRKWKDSKTAEIREDVLFHRVVAWGTLGDLCMNHLKKGDRVFCEGRINYREWNDKNNEKKEIAEIILDNIIFLNKKNKKIFEQGLSEEVSVSEVNVVEAFEE